MTTTEYLNEVLKSQNLADDSDEMQALIKHRGDVESLLKKAFKDSAPTIRYGGSKAKGSMIIESYDLDVICYFKSDEALAGGSLKEIYENVAKALEKDYFVNRKTSALRLINKDTKAAHRDFHIDVVPGRFVEGKDGDCYIYQNNAEKERMKTNIDVHIAHVKDSGVLPAIKLLKLWKVRKAIGLKQFVWELLVIDLLKGKKSKSLEDQLLHVWTTIRDTKDPISVSDPANPHGNDLSGVLKDHWSTLQSFASTALSGIKSQGWESVYGTVKKPESAPARIAALSAAGASAAIRTTSWAT